jgi:hypothetical protein
MHQTHELASRKYEGTFVLMLGGLVVLASVEGLVLQVEQAELVGAYDEVVAAIRIPILVMRVFWETKPALERLIQEMPKYWARCLCSGKRDISTISAKRPAVMTGPNPLTVMRGLGTGSMQRETGGRGA